MVAVLYISLTLLIYPNTKNLLPSDVNKLVCDLQKALFSQAGHGNFRRA